MIKEQEAGMPTVEMCRRHGLSLTSFYKFKSKYGGMNVSETHHLRSLEDENAKLKCPQFVHFYSMISSGGFLIRVTADETTSTKKVISIVFISAWGRSDWPANIRASFRHCLACGLPAQEIR